MKVTWLLGFHLVALLCLLFARVDRCHLLSLLLAVCVFVDVGGRQTVYHTSSHLLFLLNMNMYRVLEMTQPVSGCRRYVSRQDKTFLEDLGLDFRQITDGNENDSVLQVEG